MRDGTMRDACVRMDAVCVVLCVCCVILCGEEGHKIRGKKRIRKLKVMGREKV